MKRALGYYAVLVILCLMAGWIIIRESHTGRSLPWEISGYLDQGGSSYQVSSYDTTGGNNDRINIHAGDTAVLAMIEGPAVINRIWVTIDSRDPWFLRRIQLRILWDGEEEPSVQVPVGDFFGTGFAYKHYFSQFSGMTSGGYFFYLPMPFRKSARIEAINETGQELYALYYHIDYVKLPRLPRDTWYFHAQWRREVRTDKPVNYTIFTASGQGCVAGVNLNMQPYNRSLGYLEGDEMIYIDGNEDPVIHGTGTEDYFTSGWYFRNGEFAAPYHGLILKDDSTGRVAAYRFHIPDPVFFHDSIRYTIEHGHANEYTADYSSTAFWYQSEPHDPFPPFLPGAMRIPLRTLVPPGGLEAEGTEMKAKQGSCEPRDMTWAGPEWSGGKEMNVKAGKDSRVSLLIPRLEERAYNMTLYYTKGNGYSCASVFSHGKKMGDLLPGNGEIMPAGILIIKNIPADHDSLKLEFLMEGTGKDSLCMIGLDAIQLEPVRYYIPAWLILGPFPDRRKSDTERFGLDSVYSPEQQLNMGDTYHGVDDQPITWRKFITPANGYMSLWDKVSPYEFVVCYALSYVFSPVDQEVVLFIGSDDGAKVFLNGHELYRFLDVRIAVPDQDRVSLPLHQGWNSLLLKIENNFGGYAFYARILDKNQNLQYSLSPRGNLP
jgi:hypothetical protein